MKEINERNKPCVLYIAIILMIFVSAGAIPAAYSLITEPSGEELKFPDNYLKDTFFGDYLIPGWILLIVIGLFPLLIVVGLFRDKSFKTSEKFNLFSETRWQYAFGLYYGFALLIWITVQTIFVPYYFLQTVIMGIGILILIIFSTEKVRNHYKTR